MKIKLRYQFNDLYRATPEKYVDSYNFERQHQKLQGLDFK